MATVQNFSIKAGSTSNILQIFIGDSSVTTDAGLTGLAFGTAGLTAYYHKDSDTTATAISLVTMTVGTYTSSGFKEIDATNQPGAYQLCLPDAAVSSGNNVIVLLKGATNMQQTKLFIKLNPITADVIQIDGNATNGNNATLNLKKLNVVNNSGDAFVASSTGGNGSGINSSGNGTGHGHISTGGATGHGFDAVGGATSGNGINAAAVGSGTGLTAFGSGTVSILATQGISGPLDASEKTSIADTLLKRDMSAVSGEAARSLLNCLRFIRNKWSISSSTLTVTKEDDTTSAWTATLTTDGTAVPIVGFVGN